MGTCHWLFVAKLHGLVRSVCACDSSDGYVHIIACGKFSRNNFVSVFCVSICAWVHFTSVLLYMGLFEYLLCDRAFACDSAYFIARVVYLHVFFFSCACAYLRDCT